MVLQSVIEEIIAAQRESLELQDMGLMRSALSDLPNLSSHALIVSGIRRSGKSTLLFQLLKATYKDALYLNFEDPRLYDFQIGDFPRLDLVIRKTGKNVLLFDELQVIEEWERYVRQKLDEGYRIVITGSNASLLSRELGTRLTGRHVVRELFPFSFHEFIAFKGLKADESSLLQYLETGGFPAYVKTQTPEILQQLFDDILIRDIAVRYGIRDVKTLQRLALYLVSNVAKPVTANRLKSLFDVGSTSTITEYLSHLEYSYLLFFVPKFSYSQRVQLVNARKVYAIDTGMLEVTSTSFTEDWGQKFENLIFLHLRRKYRQIYYYAEKNECDFLAFDRGKLKELVQVCYQLTTDNMQRELDGLYEGLAFFKKKRGTIVTLNQKDRFEKEGMVIEVIPAHEYMQ